MNKTHIYLLVGSTLLVGGVTYGVIRRTRGNKIISEIFDMINKGTEQYGDVRDLTTSKAFDLNYWKTEKDTSKLMEWSKARDIAKKIDHCFGVFTNDEETFYSLISNIPSAIQLSQVNYQYNSLYKTTLLNKMNDKLSEEEQKRATQIIKTKKLS